MVSPAMWADWSVLKVGHGVHSDRRGCGLGTTTNFIPRIMPEIDTYEKD